MFTNRLIRFFFLIGMMFVVSGCLPPGGSTPEPAEPTKSADIDLGEAVTLLIPVEGTDYPYTVSNEGPDHVRLSGIRGDMVTLTVNSCQDISVNLYQIDVCREENGFVRVTWSEEILQAE